MKRKVLKITALALAIAAIVGGGIFAKRNDFGLGRNMEIMVNLMRVLSTEFVDEINPDKMMKDGANGITSHLDPYTVFISEEEMPDYETMATGRYGGIGSSIRKRGDYVVVAGPYQGSPADEAGLIIGDKIIAVNGKDMRGASTSDISKNLRGEPNTMVTVTIEKLLTGKQEDVKIRRRLISMPSIPYVGYVAEGIGYICHTDFTDNCYEMMRNAILHLQKSGELKSLIVDYRGNGGGLLVEAVDILSLFVPKGSMVIESRGRNGASSKYHTRHEPLLPDTPLVMLIDNGTASAAEIVTGALQDYDRAVIIGQRSFGKGLVQSVAPLGYNTKVKYTTAKYYIPSGRCIQAINYNQNSKAEEVPDSLIKEFKTKCGRKVYDGGGIMPDKKCEPEYTSNFLYSIYIHGVIEDFGDEYMKRNHTKSIDVKNFSITKTDYDDFKAFAIGREFPYKSASRHALEKLRSTLEKERNTSLGATLDAIDKGLNDDKKSCLETYREEVIDLINRDIVQRYAYNAGVIAYSIMRDNEVKEAVKILNDSAEYKQITTKQDTARK